MKPGLDQHLDLCRKTTSPGPLFHATDCLRGGPESGHGRKARRAELALLFPPRAGPATAAGYAAAALEIPSSAAPASASDTKARRQPRRPSSETSLECISPSPDESTARAQTGGKLERRCDKNLTATRHRAATLILLTRHGRACPGHDDLWWYRSTARTQSRGTETRTGHSGHKPGHDDRGRISVEGRNPCPHPSPMPVSPA